MKAQRRVGLNGAWLPVTAVFLVDIVILIAASNCPESWQGPHRIAFWGGVGLAAVIALLSLVTYCGVTPWQRLTSRLRPKATLTEGCPPAVDYQRRFGRQSVGVREHAGHLVTVVAVDDPVSLQTVATGLHQFDIHLTGIDIVTAGSAGGAHRTWLVVRMDPQRSVAAVVIRDSLAATVTSATERLAEYVAGRPLTADEIVEVDAAVLAGLETTARSPKDLRGITSSFWVTPADITTENIDRLRRKDTEATVITVRLTATRTGPPQISAWVRYHCEGALPAEASAGLNPLVGRQVVAVRASLPAPSPRPVLAVPRRMLNHEEQIVISPP